MEYQRMVQNGVPYLWLTGQGLLQSERDALDLVGICGGEALSRVLVSGDGLSTDFSRLATGVAGAVLQKLSQYEIKTALVTDTAAAKGKFVDFLLETNRGTMFRAYPTKEEALEWLLGE